jgi:AraC-like DNA-binding protein
VSSRIVHETDAIRIGAFRSRPGDADFGDSGPTRGHLLVFPREAVVIQHAGGSPIVANPNVVMIYNRGQEYTRRAISPVGDRCEWFAYSADAIIEARRAAATRENVERLRAAGTRENVETLRAAGTRENVETLRAAGRHDIDEARPFGALTHVACTPRTYLLARLAFENRGGDSLFVEEVASMLLADIFRVDVLPADGLRADGLRADGLRADGLRANGLRADGLRVDGLRADGLRADRKAALSPAHAELADAVRHYVAARYTEQSSLGAIARAHGVSAFHLARVFRRATGQSIHAYRIALRLRAALERIADREDVATVALSLGFSSHSHFTSAFRRAFGVTPSQLRSSKILTAASQLCTR